MTNSTKPVDALKGPELHIGICDSGLGGLSILSPLTRVLKSIKVSYVADDLYAPYGPLEKDVLISRALEISKLLIERGCDLIVVACNTLTAQAIDEMRAQFDISFVGVEPYVNALNKGLDEKARPAILCTVSTSKSGRFQKLVEKCDPNKRSLVWPCPSLAREIERALGAKLTGPSGESADSVLSAINNDLAGLKNESISHAILGCTHYPLVRREIESYLGVPTLSPCEHVARRVVELTKNVYADSSIINTYEFYSTKSCEWVERPLTDAKQLG